MPVHNKLKTLRQNLKLSQQSIAEKLFISQNAYSLIESGKTKIDEKRIYQLAKILNVNANELFSDEIDNIEYSKQTDGNHPNYEMIFANYKILIKQLTDQLAIKDEQIKSLLLQVDFLIDNNN